VYLELAVVAAADDEPLDVDIEVVVVVVVVVYYTQDEQLAQTSDAEGCKTQDNP